MNDNHHSIASGGGRGLVFWSLFLLGVIGFAPCVLLPEWRQYESLTLAEQAEAFRLQQLQNVVEREQAVFDAIRDDPAVLARLAQRTLRFQRDDERAIVVPVLSRTTYPVSTARLPRANMRISGLRWTPGESFDPDPVSVPAIMGGTLAALPAFDYDAVFCDDDTRAIVMVMSLGLIVFAFAVFSGSDRRAAGCAVSGVPMPMI